MEDISTNGALADYRIHKTTSQVNIFDILIKILDGYRHHNGKNNQCQYGY